LRKESLLISFDSMAFTKAISKTLVMTPERQQEAGSDWEVVRRVQPAMWRPLTS